MKEKDPPGSWFGWVGESASILGEISKQNAESEHTDQEPGVGQIWLGIQKIPCRRGEGEAHGRRHEQFRAEGLVIGAGWGGVADSVNQLCHGATVEEVIQEGGILEDQRGKRSKPNCS